MIAAPESRCGPRSRPYEPDSLAYPLSLLASAAVRFVHGAASHTGWHRRDNQDRYLADSAVFAVADGLGGYEGGETAAEIAVSVLGRAAPFRGLDQMISAVGAANAEIIEAARDDPRLREMSTTLCALAGLGPSAERPRLAVVNVGDSRLYALASGEFSRITVDHTVVENLVRDGVLTRDAAASYRDRHMLTRAVGYEPTVLVDGWEIRAVGGTRFLICSDGVTNEVPDSYLADVLRSADSPAVAARDLVDAAVRPGHGRDNATAVVVDVVDGPEPLEDDGALVQESRPAVAA